MWVGEGDLMVEVGTTVGSRWSWLPSSGDRRRLGKSSEERVLRAGTAVLGLLTEWSCN